jgi:phosphopantetheine--protein transferase-like protein
MIDHGVANHARWLFSVKFFKNEVSALDGPSRKWLAQGMAGEKDIEICWLDDLSKSHSDSPRGHADIPHGFDRAWIWIADKTHSDDRLKAHQALIGHVLGLEPDHIVLGHNATGAPIVLAPRDCGLHLSRSARPGIALVAAASQPIGVDVEEADAASEVPWNVLSEMERAPLIGLPHDKRTVAFAMLWSVKEAYLKALGIGLTREPSSFTVQIGQDGQISISDPAHTTNHVIVRALTRRKNDKLYAMSVVLLT